MSFDEGGDTNRSLKYLVPKSFENFEEARLYFEFMREEKLKDREDNEKQRELEEKKLE